MNFNRSKNSARTFVFGVICKIITILGPFATRTIIIYKLGTEYVGLTSLFTSVLSILSISELGIGSAITFCLYKPVANDDRDTVRALLCLLRKLYTYIGLVVIAVGLLLMPFLNQMIQGDCPADVNIYILYLIYLLNAATSYLGFAYKGVLLNVYQRGDISSKIESISEILKYLLQSCILLLFKNYYWFAAILPLSTLAITVSTQIVSKKLYPDLYPQGKVSWELKKLIKGKVLFLSAHSIASTLTNSVDNIIISGAMGLAATALYGNYNYISTAVLSIILIAYRALTPAIGNSLYSEEQKKNYDIFSSLSFMFFWIITWCCSCLICLFQPFITIWIGEHNLLSSSVIIMIVLFFYSNATRQLYSVYIGAAGLWDKTLPRQIIAAIANLVLDIMLVKDYGIAGIVFASFSTNFFLALPLDVYVTYKYVLKRRTYDGFIEIVKKAIITFLICGFTYFICSLVKLNSIPLFLTRVCICIIVPNTVLCMLFYRTNNFQFIKRRIYNLWIEIRR